MARSFFCALLIAFWHKIRATLINVCLQSGGSGDNFNELSSDDSLSGPVELEGELLNHLSGVLAGVVHGSHPGRLFGAGSLLKRKAETCITQRNRMPD